MRRQRRSATVRFRPFYGDGGAAVVQRSERAGHHPVPFDQFILKVNGRCNLTCRYCYVYEAADTGWRHRPAAPGPAVLDRAGERIAEHAAAHGLRDISLVLHGGEPLLTGAGVLGAAVDRARTLVPSYTTVHATMQTNATLLTGGSLRTLAEHGIRVGVSLDGGLP